MHPADSLLLRIDRYLDAAPRSVALIQECGPFTAFVRTDIDIPQLSYARPTHPYPQFTRGDIESVREFYQSQGRLCRWEFLQELAPDLPAALAAAGFSQPTPLPLMVVTPQTFSPATACHAEVRSLTEDDAQAVSRALHLAYGGAEDEDAADMITGTLRRGGTVYGAFVNGAAVGGGSLIPHCDTAEVAGIGTHPGFRRRGIASAVTSMLVEHAFHSGISCIFLSAADATVAAIYARLGFVPVGVAMESSDLETPAASAG